MRGVWGGNVCAPIWVDFMHKALPIYARHPRRMQPPLQPTKPPETPEDEQQLPEATPDNSTAPEPTAENGIGGLETPSPDTLDSTSEPEGY